MSGFGTGVRRGWVSSGLGRKWGKLAKITRKKRRRTNSGRISSRIRVSATEILDDAMFSAMGEIALTRDTSPEESKKYIYIYI